MVPVLLSTNAGKIKWYHLSAPKRILATVGALKSWFFDAGHGHWAVRAGF